MTLSLEAQLAKLDLLGIQTYFYKADQRWYAFNINNNYELMRDRYTQKAFAEETELELVQKVLENLNDSRRGPDKT